MGTLKHTKTGSGEAKERTEDQYLKLSSLRVRMAIPSQIQNFLHKQHKATISSPCSDSEDKEQFPNHFSGGETGTTTEVVCKETDRREKDTSVFQSHNEASSLGLISDSCTELTPP